MVDNYSDMKRAFVAFDKREDGFVTLNELKRVLNQFVFPMTAGLFDILMARWAMMRNTPNPTHMKLQKTTSHQTRNT